MLYLKKSTQIPSPAQTINILQANHDIRPVYYDYDKIVMNLLGIEDKIKELNDEYKGLSGYDHSRASFIAYVQERGIDKFFARTETGGISVDKESVLGALGSQMPDNHKHVVILASKLSQIKKNKSELIALLQNPIADKPSCDGHRMIEVIPEWSVQNTGRVAMSKPAVQNLSHNLQELLTVPIGYKLIHTDSGQVEPRITYSAFVKDDQIKALINLYDDAYFGVLHYCTMDSRYIQSGTLDFEKMTLSEEMTSNRKKIKAYGNGVMYGSKKCEDAIKQAMLERIGNHPARLELVSEIENKLNHGITIFETYFGTPIDITKSLKFANGMNVSLEEKIRLAINNPIQGTAADLMRYSVLQANMLLLEKTKDSSIVSYVHDAGYFCVNEDDYDKVHEDLEGIVAYQVDDWIPIHSDAETYEFNRQGAYAYYVY